MKDKTRLGRQLEREFPNETRRIDEAFDRLANPDDYVRPENLQVEEPEVTHEDPPSRSELAAEEAEADIRYCQSVLVEERRYLSNGDPGYPAEYCTNEAEEGSDYCADHQPSESIFDDPDTRWD